jgi:Putative adhesin
MDVIIQAKPFQAVQEFSMSETIEKTFTVSSPARLVVKNIRGSVDVRSGEENVIHVIAVKHTGSGDAKRTEIELIQEADGTVKAATRFPDIAFGWLFGSHPCEVDYTITAPSQCSLEVRGVSNEALAEGFKGEFKFNSVSGETTLRKLNGPVKVNTVSGEVKLEEINGEIHLNSVSGEVNGKRVAGAVHMDTVSGDIELKESNAPSAESTTVSGKVEIETPLGAGPYRFNSVSGEVSLKVPAETHCSAEMHSVSGNLRVDLPTTSQSRGGGTQTVEVQGGGVKVYLSSVSGDLLLGKS